MLARCIKVRIHLVACQMCKEEERKIFISGPQIHMHKNIIVFIFIEFQQNCAWKILSCHF